MISELGPRFKKIDESLSRMANQQLAESGLTFSQAVLLHVIEAHHGICAQRELERELAIAHPTVTGLVKRLEAKGFVETFVSAEDGRMKMVKITPEGKHATSQGRKCQIQAEQLLTTGFTQTERDDLARLLDKVIGNLNR